MLCNTCDRTQICLMQKLARRDPKIRQMLAQLKHCEMRQVLRQV